MDLMQFAFERWADRNNDEGLRDAWLASREHTSNRDWLSRPVLCNLCNKSSVPVTSHGADVVHPDTRESVLCALCRCNARVRAALGLLLATRAAGRSPAPPRAYITARVRAALDSFLAMRSGRRSPALPRVYITEQVTPTFVWMQKNLNLDLLGSEFEPDATRRESLSRILRRMGGKGHVAFQDVTRLGFADASLDTVVSFDVLEHVPDYRTAIREFSRVLRPGGSCIATFPFLDTPGTLTRARINAQGEVEHLLEPEFHGDPISGGVLCFYHFGWDILDECRSAGFRSSRMVMPYSPNHGLLYGLWTLVAEK